MRNESLLVSIRERVSKLRPYVVGAFIIAFSISPIIPGLTYRITVAASMGVALLYLAFDIYRELNQRLDGIEKSLKEPHPPTYQDFAEASAEIDTIIKERLNANRNVHIRVLAVAAQYSWKHFVEDRLCKFLQMGNRKQAIKIEYVIVNPALLKQLQQTKLMADAERTILGLAIMREKYDRLQIKRLSVNMFKFSNVPHWHGVLIDDDIFFMGRCRWNISGERYELEVGTNEYRKFSLNDRFKGTDRVNLCINWFEAYKLQGDEI
jgi:hypothetical protein